METNFKHYKIKVNWTGYKLSRQIGLTNPIIKTARKPLQTP